MMNSIAALQGMTYSSASLHQQITDQGWSVKKLSYDKKRDRFVAVGKASHGEEIECWAPTEKVALANLLKRILRLNHMRSSKLSMWTHTFTDQLPAIAQAYSKAPAYDPKAAISFMELGKDSVNRAKALQDHLEIILTHNPDPYPSPEKMHDDVRKRRRLEVSRAGLEHPIWSDEQAIAYRICHDVLGYCAAGGGWDWQGENQAFAAHAAVVPEEAQKALFTESIGQTAYATYFQAYGPAKVTTFPEFMDEAQDKMNPAKGFRGVHPTQILAPIAQPSVKPRTLSSGRADLDPRFIVEAAQPGAPGVSEGLTDPNAGFQTGIQPQQPNAYLDYGDPLESQKVLDNAKLIDTEWARLNQDDPADLARMKQAIVNAFRVVLLSPRKNLQWNAQHYQDISQIPGDESDPTTYWHQLEKSRQNWNVERFGEQSRYSHMPYFKQWRSLEQLMYQKNPKAGWEAAQKEAQQFLFRMQTRIQDQVMEEDADKPEDKRLDTYQVENETNKRLTGMLKTYIGEHQMGFDFESAVDPAQESMFDVPQVQQPKVARYGAFMGAHLQSIAQISQHVDEIMKAALTDVHMHDGSGHHFRATVMQLGISGVGPKVCSFAWLLLQPMTSQLGTIDVHMMDVLGHNYEKDMNNRDYFKFERELQAGRDASGYGHIPLGAFQWGTWDASRTGIGTHQDHSAMKVLDPDPVNSMHWSDSVPSTAGMLKNEGWWQATAPARQAVADDFDQNIAPNVPQGQIPFNRGTLPQTYSKSSMRYDDQGNIVPIYTRQPNGTMVPYFIHPQTQARIQGSPGQTLMQHARSVLGGEPEDIWSQLGEEGMAGKV
jgi:hypothetical protein